MDIRNCMHCNKIYQMMYGENLCPACRKHMDVKFKEVKAYIYDNPGVSVKEVSEELDVSVKQIQRWVKEERLEFSMPTLAGIGCERCGKAITSGKYCAQCKNDLTHSFTTLYRQSEEEKDQAGKGSKMRFLKK